jgi:hypothetical protein
MPITRNAMAARCCPAVGQPACHMNAGEAVYNDESLDEAPFYRSCW